MSLGLITVVSCWCCVAGGGSVVEDRVVLIPGLFQISDICCLCSVCSSFRISLDPECLDKRACVAMHGSMVSTWCYRLNVYFVRIICIS